MSAWMDMRESIVSLQSRSENSVSISKASRLTSKSSSQAVGAQASTTLDLSPAMLLEVLTPEWKAVSWLRLAVRVRWISSCERSSVSLKRQSMGNLIIAGNETELIVVSQTLNRMSYRYP